MTDLLKGNFQTRDQIKQESTELSAEDRFEREALKKLGGSIAFVSKKKVAWDVPEDDAGKPAK